MTSLILALEKPLPLPPHLLSKVHLQKMGFYATLLSLLPRIPSLQCLSTHCLVHRNMPLLLFLLDPALLLQLTNLLTSRRKKSYCKFTKIQCEKAVMTVFTWPPLPLLGRALWFCSNNRYLLFIENYYNWESEGIISKPLIYLACSLCAPQIMFEMLIGSSLELCCTVL